MNKRPPSAPFRRSPDLVQHYLLQLKRDGVDHWPLPETLAPAGTAYDLAALYYEQCCLVLRRNHLAVTWQHTGARFLRQCQQLLHAPREPGTLHVLLPPVEPAGQWLLDQLGPLPSWVLQPPFPPMLTGVRTVVAWAVAPGIVSTSATARFLADQLLQQLLIMPTPQIQMVTLALTHTTAAAARGTAVSLVRRPCPGSRLLQHLAPERIRAFHATLEGRSSLTLVERFCLAFTRDALSSETSVVSGWTVPAAAACHVRPLFQPPATREDAEQHEWPLALVHGRIDQAYELGMQLFPPPPAAAEAREEEESPETDTSMTVQEEPFFVDYDPDNAFDPFFSLTAQ